METNLTTNNCGLIQGVTMKIDGTVSTVPYKKKHFGI
jgi:hypothetical protein